MCQDVVEDKGSLCNVNSIQDNSSSFDEILNLKLYMLGVRVFIGVL